MGRRRSRGEGNWTRESWTEAPSSGEPHPALNRVHGTRVNRFGKAPKGNGCPGSPLLCGLNVSNHANANPPLPLLADIFFLHTFHSLPLCHDLWRKVRRLETHTHIQSDSRENAGNLVPIWFSVGHENVIIIIKSHPFPLSIPSHHHCPGAGESERARAGDHQMLKSLALLFNDHPNDMPHRHAPKRTHAASPLLPLSHPIVSCHRSSSPKLEQKLHAGGARVVREKWEGAGGHRSPAFAVDSSQGHRLCASSLCTSFFSLPSNINPQKRPARDAVRWRVLWNNSKI